MLANLGANEASGVQTRMPRQGWAFGIEWQFVFCHQG